MDHQATPSTVSANILHCALELSKKSWLLAIQFPDREQPSVYPIAGGDTDKLIATLTAARDRWAKTSDALQKIKLCYEVGYDAFWLARFLNARGIECLVIDPGSLQVSRRGRRVKTDRVDVKTPLRTLIAWCRAEPHGSARISNECAKRVNRGGSWANGPESLRSASRGEAPSRARVYTLGFRIARTLSP
jgi:hypothetical protein